MSNFRKRKMNVKMWSNLEEVLLRLKEYFGGYPCLSVLDVYSVKKHISY